MTPAEVKRCRQTLGLSQRGLARLLRLKGNCERTVRRWEDGKVPITGPASLVLDIVCNDHDPISAFSKYDQAQIREALASK